MKLINSLLLLLLLTPSFGQTQKTLDKLQEKDVVSINFLSQGCAHTESLKLTITKEDDKLIARLYDVKWDYSKKKRKLIEQFKDGSLLKSAILNNQNIQDFIRFENELNNVSGSGCTTSNLYIIKSSYLNIEKTDRSCNWHGFYNLQKSFFGEIL